MTAVAVEHGEKRADERLVPRREPWNRVPLAEPLEPVSYPTPSSPSVLIDLSTFWTDEIEGTLLCRNYGYLNHASLPHLQARARCILRWCRDLSDRLASRGYPSAIPSVRLAQFSSAGDCDEECPAKHPGWDLGFAPSSAAPDELATPERASRIFDRDCDRTVHDNERKVRYHDTLRLVYENIRDYHQGGGFVTAFFSLFLEREEVAELMWALARSPAHSKDYFRAEPDGFNRDLRACWTYCERRVPEAMVLLKQHGIQKENFNMIVVKWFVALGVHFLPFAYVMPYVEHFLYMGQVWHFRFTAAFLRELVPFLREVRDLTEMNALLRNEAKDSKRAAYQIADDQEVFFNSVFQQALHMEVHDVAEIRASEAAAWEAEITRRRQRALELAQESDDEIVFSDEEDGG